MKRNWIKALRGLMVFAVAEQIRSDDPTQGIKLERATKSIGHMTWLEPQVEQYRQRHPLGTTARLALELLLNIAARRYDAHEIGPQHVILSNKDGKKKLCWRPHKTLRTSGKMLKVRVLPSLQAALDAMPKPERGTELPLAFLTNDNGRAFASTDAFGLKFAKWCDQAGLKPVLCDDGKVRNYYRAHGLRKAALRAMAHAGCTAVEMMQWRNCRSILRKWSRSTWPTPRWTSWRPPRDNFSLGDVSNTFCDVRFGPIADI
jgi:hypothetical protein